VEKVDIEKLKEFIKVNIDSNIWWGYTFYKVLDIYINKINEIVKKSGYYKDEKQLLLPEIILKLSEDKTFSLSVKENEPLYNNEREIGIIYSIFKYRGDNPLIKLYAKNGTYEESSLFTNYRFCGGVGIYNIKIALNDLRVQTNEGINEIELTNVFNSRNYNAFTHTFTTDNMVVEYITLSMDSDILINQHAKDNDLHLKMNKDRLIKNVNTLKALDNIFLVGHATSIPGATVISEEEYNTLLNNTYYVSVKQMK
jgi:hypothetical protein